MGRTQYSAVQYSAVSTVLYCIVQGRTGDTLKHSTLFAVACAQLDGETEMIRLSFFAQENALGYVDRRTLQHRSVVFYYTTSYY